MRVIIAARLSQVQRDGRQGIGIDTQDSRATEWCTREGHEIVAVVADTKSGTVAPWDRPNLKPWVTDLEKMAQYDAVVAYRNDRLSRGEWADEARIRLWAEEHGKRLIIVDGPQWPPRNEGDKWQWEAMATQARKEWEDGRERSMRAQRELRDRGMLVGRPPWGYTVEGEKYSRGLIPTEYGREYIPQIFQRYVDGASLREIAKWLTQQDIPTPGKAWWPRTLWVMLKNPTYIGRRQTKNGRTVHTCEPLVDTALWNRAQKVLHTSGTGRGPMKANARTLLVPLCPNCRWSVAQHQPTSPMYRLSPYGDGYTYRCAGTGPQRQGCGNMVDLATVDRLVSDFLGQLDSPVYEMRAVLGTNYASELAEIEFELKNLASQGLTEDIEDKLRAQLRIERSRLQGLEPTPDRVELVDTGRTYGREWTALSAPERRKWLRDRSVRCYAAKTDAGTIQAAWPELLLRSMGAGVLLGDDGVSVVLTWLGSGIYE